MNHTAGIVSGRIDLSKVRGLLFDVDGTLSDTDDHIVGRITRFLKPVAWLWKGKDPHHFARWLVMAAETPATFLYSTAGHLGFNSTLSMIYSRFSRRRHARTPEHEHFWIVADVKEMLALLFGRYPMAVVSSREEGTTLRFLEHFDLSAYFEVIVTARTCDRTKPFPEPVQFAAQQMGLLPSECVMIGDTLMDVQAGKSAGAQTIAVLSGFGTERELRRAGADLIVSSTADILALFNINNA